MRRTDEKSLKEWIMGPLHDLESFVRMSVTLTKMVYKAHKQNEIIGIINPANIRVQIDASLAKATARIHCEPDSRAVFLLFKD